MIKVIPAAMMIESAIDSLKLEKSEDIQKQTKEFREASSCIHYGEYPEGISDLEKGYILGLQVGRIMIALHPESNPIY